MNFRSYFRLETSRIFRSRISWLVMALTICAPIAGYLFYHPATFMHESRIGLYIANPVLAGALDGAVLFSLLTLYELDRVHRKKMAVLTDTVVSPLVLNVSKLFSILSAATVTVGMASIVYLPYTIVKMGDLWDAGYYLFGCFGLMLPTIWCGILLAAALYQLTRKLELSFVVFAALIFLSMSSFFSDQFLFR